MLAALPPLVGLAPLVLALLIWQFMPGEPSPNFPPPAAWWTALRALAEGGALLPALVETLRTFVLGLAVASAGGFALGILIGTLRPLRDWTSLLLEYLRALPPPVVVPIALLMLGFSDSMKLSVIGISAAWPILLNTVAAVRGLPPLLADVARSLHMSWIRTVVRIVLPATIPGFLVGLRVAMSLAIVVTLLVEILTGLPGLGVLMVMGQRNYNSAQVFGLLALVGVLAYGLTLIFSLLEAFILRRWPPRAGQAQ
jgi:ABC-type nitrate/sulfonate/bicarbonate transport system permease component